VIISENDTSYFQLILSCILRITSLTRIYANGNNIASAPENLCQLPNIQVFRSTESNLFLSTTD
jgi:hypothetical protein